MAMLMAINIIEGRYTYNRVPKPLKAAVKANLEASGFTVNDKGELVELKD